MIKKILTTFLTTFLTIGLVVNCISNSSELKHQKNSKVNNFFVLGDSLSDGGNLCAIINEFGNKLENPCQKLFSSSSIIEIKETIKYLKNFSLPEDYYKKCSFSNGPVAAKIFAKKLGIELSCGYKIDYSINWPVTYKLSANRKGNNYAVGGSNSSYSQTLLESLSNFSLPSIYQSRYKKLGWKEWILQIIEDAFLSLISIKKQTASLLEHHKINSKDLFFVEIGGNDIFSLYGKIKPKIYSENRDFTSLIEKENDISICSLKESLEHLLRKGANKIMLANCVNVANTPFAKNLNERNKKILENITNSFNSKWSNMFNEFEYKYPSVFKKVDFNFICNKLLAQFNKQRFNITDPIADYNVENFTEIIFGGSKTPIINANSKEEKDKYFFFDLIHPSAKIHHLLAEELYKIYETWYKKSEL